MSEATTKGYWRMPQQQRIYRYRFIIHLPTLDNDGNPIPLQNIERAFLDLRKRFGGYTTSSYVGYPNYQGYYCAPDGTTYTDYVYLIYVDVEDSQRVAAAVKFFQRFKQKYMKLFQQFDIYIVYFQVTKIN